VYLHMHPQTYFGPSGIAFSNVTNGVVIDSRIEGFWYGISTSPGGNFIPSSNLYISGNSITDTSISNSGIAIFLRAPTNVVVSNNTIVRNDVGISIESSRGVSVSGNTVDGNGVGVIAYSPYLGNSGNIAIIQNEISNNGKGVILHFTFDVVVYHNNFDNNYIQAIDTNSTTNSWDNGYPSGGNHCQTTLVWTTVAGPIRTCVPAPTV